MGCDIHLFVEANIKGRWRRLFPPEWYWDEVDRSVNFPDWLAEWREKRRRYVWYGDRNYDAFAILADVRNAVGFAGVQTASHRLVPLSEPRGWPPDVGIEVMARRADVVDEDDESGDVTDGDHSHSWCTLQELLEYDWEQVVEHTGYVEATEYLRWKQHKRPASWCGGVSGRDVRIVSNSEMERLIAAGDTQWVYTEVTWVETYADAAGRLYSKLIPALVKIAEDMGVGPEDVRLVYSFDS